MALLQQPFPKIKLKLEQPAIMCSGREKVECYFRGKIICQNDNSIGVEFKSFGEKQYVAFNTDTNECISAFDKWKDLKIIK